MDILDALQDIRARNARNERVGKDTDELLARIGLEEEPSEEDQQRKREEEEDEKLVREVFSKVHVPTPGSSSDASGSAVITVKRKADQLDAARAAGSLSPAIVTSIASVSAPVAKKKKVDGKSLGIKITKKPKVATA